MTRVNMMDTLVGFDEALRAKQIKTARMPGNEKIHIHQDMPAPMTPRITYARLKGAHVTAVAVITFGDPVEGVRCFHIGYAVREDQRGNGLAKELVAAALEDFAGNMHKNGLDEFWFEASVDRDNLASAAVAKAVLNIEPEDRIDDTDGTPIWHYLKHVSLART